MSLHVSPKEKTGLKGAVEIEPRIWFFFGFFFKKVFKKLLVRASPEKNGELKLQFNKHCSNFINAI